MFVIPKNSQGFSEAKYWDTFFKRQGRESFEWYGSYTELCGVLHQYIKKPDKVLVVGSGNSEISPILYKVGYHDITNIDISKTVITRMRGKYARKSPGLNYILMDATKMTFDDNTFTAVLDKGTLDALFTENSPEAQERVEKLLNEITRTMKEGGRFVCISMLQDFVLEFILNYFEHKPYLVRICRCVDIEKDGADKSQMPIFAVIISKFKQRPNLETVYELSLNNIDNNKMTKTDILHVVKSTQLAEIMCGVLTHSNINTVSPVGESVLEISRPGDKTTRYTIIVKDKPDNVDAKRMTYCAFVVPPGKQSEWVFVSEEGRQALLKECGRDRVAIVVCSPDYEYPAIEDVQVELTEVVVKLAPISIIIHKLKVPFMTIGAAVGSSTVLKKGNSEFSGEYTVEDFEDENKEVFRRLYFAKRNRLIQSEAKVKCVDIDGKKVKQVDDKYVSSEYQMMIIIGVQMALNASSVEGEGKILLLGLGGGVLCKLLRTFFPKACIDAVDIDPEVCQVATELFGLCKDENMNIIISDGLKVLQDHASERFQKEVNQLNLSAKERVKVDGPYDVIIFDIDSKDPESPISCPPLHFLDPYVLNNVLYCMKEKTGLFLMNFVCRSETERSKFVPKFLQYFKNAVTTKSVEDVNEVMVAWHKEADFSLTDWTKAVTNIQDMIIKEELELDKAIAMEREASLLQK